MPLRWRVGWRTDKTRLVDCLYNMSATQDLVRNKREFLACCKHDVSAHRKTFAKGGLVRRAVFFDLQQSITSHVLSVKEQAFSTDTAHPIEGAKQGPNDENRCGTCVAQEEVTEPRACIFSATAHHLPHTLRRSPGISLQLSTPSATTTLTTCSPALILLL